jgi:N-acetylglucosaminyldiphosphoundecaprenol N-acetyl-beta-D-mannosaminyltransferase
LSSSESLPAIELAGVRMLALRERECADLVLSRASAGRGGKLVTPNVDILRQCVSDPELRALVEGFDVVVADGMPLIWASRLQGTPLPERVAGSNLIHLLAAGAAERGLSLFMLGGEPGTAEAAANVLVARHPSLRIAGCYCPPFGFERDPRALEAIESALVAAKPDIVFVAMGFPKSERLAARLSPLLPRAWWAGVGISFSFLSGEVRRAPLWMQRSGLEWLHRLIQEPKRLGRRYLVHGIPFALRLLGGAALARHRRVETRATQGPRA